MTRCLWLCIETDLVS